MVLIAGLIGCVSIFPVSADDQAISGQGITLSKTKSELLASIPNDATVSKADIAKAEELRLAAQAEMDKAINGSLSSMAIMPALSTVFLGTNQTFYSADWGNKDKGKSWFPNGIWDSDYYTGYACQDEAVTTLGPGAGSAWAYAQVGTQFTVSGSGSQVATIRMSGWYDGYLLVALAGSTSVEMNLVIKDLTNSTTYTDPILNESRSLAGEADWNQGFVVGETVLLQAGHTYLTYLELKTSSAVWSNGLAFSDWGHEDGDSGQYAQYYWFAVEF